jgi:hypothetical protein
VFRDLDTHLALVDYLDTLPVRGTQELLIRYPRVLDYARAAERGLFAFDYEAGQGKSVADDYRLVACPADPLPLDALPHWARDWLEGIRIPGAAFAGSRASVIHLSALRSDLVA